MKYEFTKDLETGNALIDSEHRQLLAAVNELMDACSSGRGRSQVEKTTRFLLDYVKKHFADEEALQMKAKYPTYTSHKAFHESYKQKLAAVGTELLHQEANIASVAKLNQEVAVLINHIKIEDKKLAAYLKNN